MFSSYYLIILTIGLDLLLVQNNSEFNVCDQNIEIKAAFRWKSNLFFFGQSGQQWRVTDFQWDRENITFKEVLPLDSRVWNKTSKKIITTTIVYPGKGLRVLEVEIGMVCKYYDLLSDFTTDCLNCVNLKIDGIPEFLAHLLDLDDSGGITSREEININLYKYGFKEEPMNLVSLFSRFPEEDLGNRFISMTSFPQPNHGLLPRFFVYYKGMDQHFL